jgi:hypothetical protein
MRESSKTNPRMCINTSEMGTINLYTISCSPPSLSLPRKGQQGKSVVSIIQPHLLSNFPVLLTV